MSTKIINFLIGLPCSGKSTFLSKLKNVDIIDDPTNFEDVINQITSSKFNRIWISDPYFCNSEILQIAKQKISENFDNFIFDEYYFENNLEKCLNNLEKRNKNSDFRKVKNFIIQFSKIYVVNKQKNILKIN